MVERSRMRMHGNVIDAWLKARTARPDAARGQQLVARCRRLGLDRGYERYPLLRGH